MKIIGNKHEEVNSIRLTHGGKDLHFKHFTNPVSYREKDVLLETQEAQIIFADIREIEQMIDMLQELKEFCYLKMGKWRKE